MFGIFAAFTTSSVINVGSKQKDEILDNLLSKGPDNQTSTQIDNRCVFAHN